MATSPGADYYSVLFSLLFFPASYQAQCAGTLGQRKATGKKIVHDTANAQQASATFIGMGGPVRDNDGGLKLGTTQASNHIPGKY